MSFVRAAGGFVPATAEKLEYEDGDDAMHVVKGELDIHIITCDSAVKVHRYHATDYMPDAVLQ